MHVRNGSLRIGLGVVENVGCTTIRARLPVDRKIEIVNVAVLAEDLVEVVFVDILRQSLDNNLCGRLL